MPIRGKDSTCLFRIHFTFALSNRRSWSGRSLNHAVLNHICGSEDNDHVRRAFELEPDNQLARRRLIILVWGRVDFEAYELPVGYLGNVDKDLAILSEVEELLKGLSNEEDHLSLAADLSADRRLIEEHLRKGPDC